MPGCWKGYLCLLLNLIFSGVWWTPVMEQWISCLALQGHCGGLHVFYVQHFEMVSCWGYCRIGSAKAVIMSCLVFIQLECECEVCLHSWQEVK